ncbi:MAG: hypothetical protein O7D95_03035 [Betaproteobacteria bacterium]|nr:hypothetical protein [Betaproteobacteria bacterium]
MCKLDKNIPIPKNTRGAKPVYVFSDMDIGDSKLFPNPTAEKARDCAYKYRRRHPEFEFTSMKVDTGIRIWRIPVDNTGE